MIQEPYYQLLVRFGKTETDNSTVGIILCKKKHTALVEIALPGDANIHAREYQLYLPCKEELQQKLLEWIKDQDAAHIWFAGVKLKILRSYFSSPRLSFTAEMKSCSAPRYRSVV